MPKPKPRQRATPVERWISLADPHGDKQCPDAIAAARHFVKHFKPDRRIFLGDAFDFRQLRNNASQHEKIQDKAGDDFACGMDFLGWYKPHVFLWGNHDWRIHKAIKDDSREGAERTLYRGWIEQIEHVTRGASHLEYCKRKGVHSWGDYSFVHGYTHGLNAAREAAKAYGNVIMGHVHRFDTATVPALTPKVGRSCGSLCLLDLDYNRAQLNTLAQENGWYYGFRINGRLIVYEARRVGDRWIYPTEFAVQ